MCGGDAVLRHWGVLGAVQRCSGAVDFVACRAAPAELINVSYCHGRLFDDSLCARDASEVALSSCAFRRCGRDGAGCVAAVGDGRVTATCSSFELNRGVGFLLACGARVQVRVRVRVEQCVFAATELARLTGGVEGACCFVYADCCFDGPLPSAAGLLAEGINFGYCCSRAWVIVEFVDDASRGSCEEVEFHVRRVSG